MSTLTNKNQFIIDVPNLGGGRNTKDSNTLINDIEAVDIENFDFEERGALKKVNGSYKLNTTKVADAPVNSLYEAIKSDGTSHLLAFCGTGIYVSTDGGSTFSLLKSGFEANKKWSCYTYADNVIMVNGVVVGKGTTIITPESGKRYVEELGLRPYVIDISKGFLYRGTPGDIPRPF